MRIRRILVPTDFSPRSDAALRYAADLAATFRSTLYVLSVVPESELERPMAWDQFLARRRLRGLVTPLQRQALDIRDVVSAGDPATMIVCEAAARAVDMIVIGAHSAEDAAEGRGVAGRVMRTAPCPVLTIRCEAPGVFAEHHWQAVRSAAEEVAFVRA